MAIWINRTLGTVEAREVRRVFRNQIGDWCAEVIGPHGTKTQVFDHHPSIPALRILQNNATDISEDVIAQGAEGINVRRRTGRADAP